MQMRTASAISTGLHAAVLLFAVVTFTGKSLEATPVEALPVDMVSEKDFSEMTKGAKTAPKAEIPKALAEKIDQPKPNRDPGTQTDRKKGDHADRGEDAGAATADQARSNRRENQEAGRLQTAGQGRAAATEEAPAEAAAQVRRRQDRGLTRQARSATQRRDWRAAQFGAEPRRCYRQRRPIVAIGNRCAAFAADIAVESTNRNSEPARLRDPHSHPTRQRPQVERAADGSLERDRNALQLGARQRSARGIPGSTLRYAQARAL